MSVSVLLISKCFWELLRISSYSRLLERRWLECARMGVGGQNAAIKAETANNSSASRGILTDRYGSRANMTVIDSDLIENTV